MKLSVYAKQLGLSYNTAWRMWKRGEIKAYQLPSGTVIVDHLPQEEAPKSSAESLKTVVIYARVSSAENKANLDTQAERLVTFCNAHGWSVGKIVKECGSGVNDQRPKFLALLADATVRYIVVEHKDRASRFGVAYVQTLLASQNRELIMVNEAANGEDDLMGDFVAIITSFTARLYGRRRARRKTAQVLKALDEEPTPAQGCESQTGTE